MKIETISVMQRKNLGNYEHIEISASAKVEDGEEAFAAILSLKTIIHAALEGKAQEKKEELPVEVPQEPELVDPVKEETPVRAKRGPKAKVKPVTTETVDAFNGQDIPPVIPEEAKKPKSKNILYTRSLETHKNTLSIYLTNTFPGWKASKPKEEIIAFTGSLEGKEFLDESGEIVESFKKVLSGFFGA